MENNILIKLNNLKSLGFDGDLSEIEKMYQGEFFDNTDKNYLKLLQTSKKLCQEIYSLSARSATASETERERIASRKQEIIKALFPISDMVMSSGKFDVVAGMVDFNGLAYLNHNVNFSPNVLVRAEEYFLCASNVAIGSDKFDIVGNKKRCSQIIVGKDVWLGADVKVDNGTVLPDNIVVGMKSHITDSENLKPAHICVGNPCKSKIEISENYRSKHDTFRKVPKERLNFLIAHLRNLGFDGDFQQYINAASGLNYNCLEPTMSAIEELSHNLCAEYNSGDTSKDRKAEILDILLPIKGKNVLIGDNLFIDVIGLVSIGDNVSIGKGAVLAGNISIGSNTEIGDNVTLQTIGHLIPGNFRHIVMKDDLPVDLQYIGDNEFAEICTTGHVDIADFSKIGNNVSIGPTASVNGKIENNSLVVNSKIIGEERVL